jgi:hypothetical protein
MPFGNSGINLAKQSEFIRRHGETLNYFVSMKCTCSILPTGSMVPDANRADPNCIACKGLGLIWIAQGQIIGMVTNVSQQKDLLQSGVAAPGDLVLSPDLDYTVSDYDKVEMTWTDGIPYEGQLVTRTTGSAVDTVNYPILSAVNCIQIAPVTGIITTYVVNIDFTFSRRQITWISINKPADGTFYSFKYGALIEWICFAPPQPRMERGTNLGQRIVMRKKHLVTFGQ